MRTHWKPVASWPRNEARKPGERHLEATQGRQKQIEVESSHRVCGLKWLSAKHGKIFRPLFQPSRSSSHNVASHYIACKKVLLLSIQVHVAMLKVVDLVSFPDHYRRVVWE